VVAAAAGDDHTVGIRAVAVSARAAPTGTRARRADGPDLRVMGFLFPLRARKTGS
jgi:hypothetical protein